MMKQETINNLVLLALVLTISILFLSMIHQFLMPLLMAGIFSAMLSPLHVWLTKKLGGRTHIASMITIIGIVVLVLTPLTILVGVIAGQAVSVSQAVTPFVQELISEPTVLTRHLEELPFYEELQPYRDILIERAGQAVATISGFLVNSLSSATKMTINALIGVIIMLYVMFYFFSMGNKLLYKILYFLPLRDEDEQRLLKQFTSVTRATLKGTLIIGIMQGSICGFAFFLAGIEGAVFWGSVMAVSSVIPAVGTFLVWIPAAVILALIGDWAGVMILVVICGLISGNLDNLVRPRLVGKDTQMHDLFILFGTLGGLSMFGILGIIIGPIIAALFNTIWSIYGDAFRDFLPDVGKALTLLQAKPDDVPPVEEKET